MAYLTFQKSNCKNCHKCIRHCPVKSIRFTGNQAHVIANECILCGRCYVVCPQNAKRIVDETELVSVLLGGDAPVIASIAPSFTAYFDGLGIGALRKALCALGFADAEETALGATMVKREYERIAREGAQDIILTSCCHTVNLLVQKYYPELVGCLAPVLTPMQAHRADIRRRRPEAKVVFIGPCLSKKDEANESDVDAALTFEELTAMLDKAHIALSPVPEDEEKGRARIFPTDGGILKSMTERSDSYTYLAIDGLESCMATLNDIRNGGVHRCFIEMSACEGSCVSGPIMEKRRHTPLRDYRAVADYAGEQDFALEQPSPAFMATGFTPIELDKRLPGKLEIEEILHKMGKNSPEDELNCGTCGYDTCRDKAVAVYQGKAEITMCLPYLMEKTERFTDNILDNTPNGILVVNESFEVQQINEAAMRMLRVRARSDVMGEPLIRLLDPTDFIRALDGAVSIANKRDYYAELGSYLELTIVHDRKSGNLIGLFRDVTAEENARRSKETLSRQTVETADRVVDKQMRIVQQIASLLGETAAETKIALTKLKESIDHEDE